ncbi:MAG: P-loop NTPase fold protein [Planctomycetota bacterium]
MNFRSVGQNNQFVDRNIAEELWRLILEINPDLKVGLSKIINQEPERVTQSAELLNDSAKGPMFVDITKEVEAFTYMMVSEDLKPPLSIGLFGKWGTGKSFFMHKMHEGIEELVHKKQISVTKVDDNNPDKIDICEHVLQIQFNAWHYVDSNLWASLVNHIFEEISTYVGNKTPEERKENKLYKELETNKRLIEETNNTLKSIKAEQDRRQTILNNFQEQKEKVKASLQEVSLKGIYENISQNEDVEATLKKATEAISELGFINEQDNVEKLQSLITQYSGTWQKIKNIYNEFKGTWQKVLMLFLIVFIFVIAFFPVFYPSIIEAIIPEINGKVGPWKSFFKTFLAQIAAIVIPLLGFLFRFMPKAKVALDRLNSGVSYLEKARDKVKHLESIATRELDMKIRKMEYRLVDLKEQEANSLEEKKQIDFQVRKIEVELDDIKQGKQLAAFIERRSNSNDYKQHLGLVYLIQRDFRHLSDFLSKEKNSLHPEKDKRIDRIILYIDDLDRCPPNKVLEVLEAVHLVLAFPLFVVVVGVDTRWIYKSLIKSRKLMLRATELNEKVKAGEDLVSGVSPYEYMEKIFQVPFRINPLNNEARKDLLTGVLSRNLIRDESNVIPSQQTIEQTEPVSKAAKLKNSQDQLLEVEEPVTEDESGFEEEGEETEEVLQKLEQTRRKLDRLKISREEYDFIHFLTPILGGTPRTIKRFINTFKLLKSNDGWFCFPQTSRPAYKEILFMNAVVNGSPNFSILFYKELRKAAIGNKTLSQFVNELKPMEDDKQTTEEQTLLKEFLNESSSREIAEIKLSDLKTISHKVARFSFRLTDYALL